MNRRRWRHACLACLALMLLALPLTALATAEEDANKELATRWVTEFVITGSLDAAYEMASPGFAAHNLAGDTMTLAGFKEVVNEILAGTRDREFAVTSLVAEENLVAIQWVMEGTRSWRRISPWTLNGLGILRMENGQITEIWYSHAYAQGAPE